MSADHFPGIDPPRLPVKGAGPKGLAPYQPRSGSKAAAILSAAQATVEQYAAQGRLPLGSREVGYVLTEQGWTHDDIPYVEAIVERARRAGMIDWDAIADGRTSSNGAWTVDGPDDIVEWLLHEIATAQLDRQAGQPYRVEVWAEAAAWLARLRSQCAERGVRVYSGSGSVPVKAVRNAARRVIWSRQPTVILWIGDLDVNGLRNIATPFADDLRQFVIDLHAQHDLATTATAALMADASLVVRRLLVTPDQVREHVGESAWSAPSAADRDAGWPWDFTVQAEALRPEMRDEIVADALDGLLDPAIRQGVIDAEVELRREAAERLRAALGDGQAS